MDATEYGAMMDKYTACGVVATAVAMAKDVGILNVLYNSEEELTSQHIADKAGLKERYVRELMGALVTGEVVQVDETSTLFHIRQELKPVLKAKTIMNGMVPYFGLKFDAIMKCFDKDGPAGVRLSEYPGIFDIMDQLRLETQDRIIERDILPSAAGLVEKLETGIEVAELGSANGILLLNLCERFPKSKFTGTDVVESVLDVARMRASDRGIKNAEFIILDACHIPQSPPKKYDWIFARDVIHDIPDPQGALLGIYRMLKPGGIFSMIEYGVEGSLADNVGNLSHGFLHTAGIFICIPESYQSQESAALGPCWGVKKAREMLADTGLKLLNEHRSEWNPNEVTFVCQKPV